MAETVEMLSSKVALNIQFALKKIIFPDKKVLFLLINKILANSIKYFLLCLDPMPIHPHIATNTSYQDRQLKILFGHWLC